MIILSNSIPAVAQSLLIQEEATVGGPGEIIQEVGTEGGGGAIVLELPVAPPS